MNRKLFVLSLALVSLVAPAFGDEEASERIAEAVKAIRPLAQSGVATHKVKPTSSVKEALFALAVKQGYSSDKSDFSWVGTSSEAWDADSTNFGETNMKQAYDYIMSVEEEVTLTPALKKKIANAKEGFKLFLNSGVKFGVAPMGAIQCGVTFAALAIIDPATGKIYLFAKEGSGC